jgi:adenylate cyclase
VATLDTDQQAVELAFWETVKDARLASDYEAYLERYPEGNFAVLARSRLDAIERDDTAIRDPQDREVELSFWESVRGSENAALIQAYLDKYPHGEFKALAEIRLADSSAT